MQNATCGYKMLPFLIPTAFVTFQFVSFITNYVKTFNSIFSQTLQLQISTVLFKYYLNTGTMVFLVGCMAQR